MAERRARFLLANTSTILLTVGAPTAGFTGHGLAGNGLAEALARHYKDFCRAGLADMSQRHRAEAVCMAISTMGML